MTDQKEKLLGPDTTTITGALQASLYDLLDLQGILKQAHWNVRGLHFRAVHLQLDEIYADVLKAVDEVAERIVTLGVAANGQSADVAKHSSLDPIAKGFQKDLKVVELITDRVGKTCELMRERMARTEEPDPVTADLLHGVLATLEKHHWMLRSQLD